MVDPNYLTNGLVEQAMELVDQYINKLQIKGLSRTIIKNQKGVPLVCYVVEATCGSKKNMMMYGHLDKQPYGPGWDEDKQPTVPVIINNRMYGRGGADDGYSAFSCMLALKGCQE